VDRWTLFWRLAKDAAMTGTGLALIVSQAVSARPSDALLIAGLALTGLGASFHVTSLVSGYFGSPPSPSPALESSSPPGRQSDDPAGGEGGE